MVRRSRMMLAAAAVASLVACGGSDPAPAPAPPTSPPPPPAPTAVKGVMIDGYVSGASVFCDVNGNQGRDPSEEIVLSNAGGGYELTGGCNANVIGFGGTNTDTGFPFLGQLMAPPGSTVITPLTTLLAGTGLSRAQLAALLGLPAGTDVTTIDIRDGQHQDLLKRTLAIQQMIDGLAKIIAAQTGGNLRDAYAGVAAGLGAALSALPASAVLLAPSGTVDPAVLLTTANAIPSLVALGISPGNLAAALDTIRLEAEQLAQATDDELASLVTQLQNPAKPVVDTTATTNFLSLSGDALKFNGGSVSVAQLQAGAGITGLTTIGLDLAVAGTPAADVTSSIALDLVEQAGDNRKLQLMIDRVNLKVDAQQKVSVSVPAGAKVCVYGHTANGTDINLTITDLAFKPITVVNNGFSLNYTNMVNKVLASVDNTTQTTAAKFTSIKGTFAVRVVISDLNLRHPDASAFDRMSVTITNTSQKVSGFGVSGTLTIH